VLTAGGVSSLFGKFSNKPPVFNYQKGIDFIQSYWTCSTKSAFKDFEYRQNVPLEKGIADTINWYKEMKWL
jgi:nucleoside-diphosphate-sugar epimerase